jgi:ElaA protein
VTTTLRSARPSKLDASTVLRILQLRIEVFVVEQNCAYSELDGRDLEPDAVWVWAAETGTGPERSTRPEQVIATLRILRDADGRARIGRVATAKSARSGGVASSMMNYALDEVSRWPGKVEITLDAQSYLEYWYQRFGFESSGAEFLEDGIPHIPMIRTAP